MRVVVSNQPEFMEIALFLLGILFGVWWFTVIILPLFYGFLRTLWFAGKGVLRLKSSLHYLYIFFVWNIIFTVLIIVLRYFSPSVVDYLYNSQEFLYGQMLGVIGLLFRAMTASGRKDLHDDFWAAMEKYRCETTT